MSVQKLDFSSVKQAKKGFTTLLNEVVQNIHDGFTLGVYTYLSTLPPDWNINRVQLMRHFKVGRDKMNNSLAWLNDNFLLEYKQDTDENGQFLPSYIEIQDGTEFLKNYKDNITRKTATLKNRCTDLPVPGETAPTNTIDNTNIISIQNCSSKDELVYFDEFWKEYPRKQDKIDAKKIWKRDKLDKIANTIIEDVRKRYELYWKFKHKDHIRMPSTYLNKKGWEDELIPASVINDVQTKNNKETRSNVPWFNNNH